MGADKLGNLPTPDRRADDAAWPVLRAALVNPGHGLTGPDQDAALPMGLQVRQCLV